MQPRRIGGFKLFVRASESNGYDEQPNTLDIKYFNVAPLTGEKAKEFYENLLKSTSQADFISNKNLNCTEPASTELRKLKVSKQQKILPPCFKNEDLLCMAQNNDVINLRKFFSFNQNYNINIVDDFGWTPLMCASCSGAEDAVKILLQEGADSSKRDKLGNCALKLAKTKQFHNIVQILENYKQDNKCMDIKKLPPPKTFYCELCKERFATDQKKHETSTLHVFNCKHRTLTHYGIPENNKGFQLLIKEGWDKEQGLGPRGTGRKFPIKANIKKNRCGLGVPNLENEEHNFIGALNGKYYNKKIINFKRTRENQFEKNFRLEFL